MSFDPETSFSLDNLQGKELTENKIPRSPAVDTYESYAAWRKKKFPSKPLNYKAEDYTIPKTRFDGNENFSNENPSNFVSQKSSYFPVEAKNPSSENLSNRNPTDLMLQRSAHFSSDTENLTSATNSDTNRKSIRSKEENYRRYNPNDFQGNEKESEQIVENVPDKIKTSPSYNKISREAQHYLRKYSAHSDNSSSPSSSSPRLSRRKPVLYSPNSQNYGSPRNLRTDQREVIHDPNNSRMALADYDPRSNPNTQAFQPVKYKTDHRNSFPTCNLMEHRSREPEHTEMMKGLLKLIDNQNEQIKNLQAQLDRLLKIHEATLKEKAKCICSFEIPRHNSQICMQAYNAPLHTKNSSLATENFMNQGVSKNRELNQLSNESNITNRRNFQFEDHSKKTVLERKVSIGVMTSFEFTVQNSPFNLEAEDQPMIEEQEDEEVYQEETNSPNVDHSRRKQNLFSLMPSSLENIIEDSESHLSSSQQPSSNCCVSSCKSGNLQTQNSKCRIVSGSNSSNTNKQRNFNNGNNFDNSNIPNHFNTSNQNYSNNPNTQNSGEIVEQNIEIRKQNDTGRDFHTQNTSLNTRSEHRARTPNRHENSKNLTRTPDLYRGKKNRRDRQNEKADKVEATKNEDNFQEESIILSGGQLEVEDRGPPSPEPSIHVDMQEYSSEDGSVHAKRSPKVGWTFYNNVLGQVNHILQNTPIEEEDNGNTKGTVKKELDKKILIDTVKTATLDQLKKLGISFVDNNEAKEANKK